MSVINAKYLVLFILTALGSVISAQQNTMYVDGRFLYDRCGEKVILRGANVGMFKYAKGIESIPELARTGANSARLTFRWIYNKNTPQMVDSAIQLTIENDMIPVAELHDATGKWSKLKFCVDYWCRPEMVEVLRKHERYLILNIANEAGNFDVTDSAFRAEYKEAILRLRAAGLHMPLMIDAAGWGRRQSYLLKNGNYLLENDPQHNLIFSWHPWDAKKPQSFYKETIDQSIQENICMVVGEFSHIDVLYKNPIDYQYIMQYCQEQQIGWLVWWWYGNDQHSLTEDGVFGNWANLPYGENVTVSGDYCIANTSVRPHSVMHRGGCESGENVTGPTAPANLRARVIRGTKVELVWDDLSDDELNFDIEVKTDGEWQLFETVEANSTSAILGANMDYMPIDWARTRKLAYNSTYSIRVGAFKAHGAVGYSEEVTVTTEGDPSTSGYGTGLKGEYFNKPESGNHLDYDPVLTRTDSCVDFNWKTDSPDPTVDSDHFVVRWTGQIEPEFSETYTIYTNTDDFAKLWINGERIITNWEANAKGWAQGNIELQKGIRYNIRFEYRDWDKLAKAQLFWASPSLERQIIPFNRLYPETGSVSAFYKPSTDQIKPFLQSEDHATLELIDLRGRVVFRKDVSDISAPTLKNTLVTEGLPPGLLILRISNGNGAKRNLIYLKQ